MLGVATNDYRVESSTGSTGLIVRYHYTSVTETVVGWWILRVGMTSRCGHWVLVVVEKWLEGRGG